MIIFLECSNKIITIIHIHCINIVYISVENFLTKKSIAYFYSNFNIVNKIDS